MNINKIKIIEPNKIIFEQNTHTHTLTHTDRPTKNTSNFIQQEINQELARRRTAGCIMDY